MARVARYSVLLGALGIALLVATFLLWLITDLSRSVLLLAAGIAIVLIGFYVITRPRDALRDAGAVRTATRSGNVLVVALAIVGIVGAVNFIVDKQFSQRLDVTATGEHTLSPQTVQVLKGLKAPVRVTGFFTPQTESQRRDAEKLLKDYQLQSSILTVTMVDPDENPALAQQYENALPGTLVFEATGAKPPRTEKVYSFDESAFTNAILKVTQTQQPAVYFTTGHGEYNPSNTNTDGISATADYLKQVNYKVEPLNLATITGTLPADTRALVIAGPTKAFSADEAKRVQQYLDGGGRVLLLAEPNTDTGLGDLLKAWGLTLDNNLILDPGMNYGGNLPIPVFLTFGSSPVTQNLESFGVFFPGVRSLTLAAANGKDATPLFTTTDKACAKTDFAAISQQTQLACDAADKKGPFVVGYAVEGAGTGGASPDARARLVAIGNAAFATNRWMQSQQALGNQQLFDNIVNWLAGQEELIAIPARPSNQRPLSVLTQNDLVVVGATSVALLPLAALIIGGLLWWRKR